MITKKFETSTVLPTLWIAITLHFLLFYLTKFLIASFIFICQKNRYDRSYRTLLNG